VEVLAGLASSVRSFSKRPSSIPSRESVEMYVLSSSWFCVITLFLRSSACFCLWALSHTVFTLLRSCSSCLASMRHLYMPFLSHFLVSSSV